MIAGLKKEPKSLNAKSIFKMPRSRHARSSPHREVPMPGDVGRRKHGLSERGPRYFNEIKDHS